MRSSFKHTILISAFNLYKGGSLAVYAGLVEGISDNHCIILISSSMKKALSARRKFIPIGYPASKCNVIYRLFIEQIFVPILGVYYCVPKIVMMGNFPSILWWGKQVVFFHNLLYIQQSRQESLFFKLEKIFFWLLIYFKRPIIVVQTNVVKDLICNSLPFKIFVVVGGHPIAPQYTSPKYQARIARKRSRSLSLFYPAFAYAHKNHALLLKLIGILDDLDLDISVTITEQELYNGFAGHRSRRLHCCGRLSHTEVVQKYRQSDALLFMSSSESLGIPLLEACLERIPIIAPRQDYVRAVVSNCYEFDLESIYSLRSALECYTRDARSRGRAQLPELEISTSPSHFFKCLSNPQPSL